MGLFPTTETPGREPGPEARTTPEVHQAPDPFSVGVGGVEEDSPWVRLVRGMGTGETSR